MARKPEFSLVTNKSVNAFCNVQIYILSKNSRASRVGFANFPIFRFPGFGNSPIFPGTPEYLYRESGLKKSREIPGANPIRERYLRCQVTRYIVPRCISITVIYVSRWLRQERKKEKTLKIYKLVTKLKIVKLRKIW